MIKIYVGDINAVSGESAIESSATGTRRMMKKAKQQTCRKGGMDECNQDYLVVPEQRHLDGFAVSTSKVRQFSGAPFGSIQPVERQTTDQDSIISIQFEVTPCIYQRPLPDPPEPRHVPEGPSKIIIKDIITNFVSTFNVDLMEDVFTVQERIYAETGWHPDRTRLRYGNKQMESAKRLSDYGVTDGDSLYLFIFVTVIKDAMDFSPTNHYAKWLSSDGGHIEWFLREDRWTRKGSAWLPDMTTVFNVQIINPAKYQAVTEEVPQLPPLEARDYSKQHAVPRDVQRAYHDSRQL
jgi:hypothetical protein